MSRPTRVFVHQSPLVLETEYDTDHGAVTVIDCMPPRSQEPDMIRLAVGRRGRVRMRMPPCPRCMVL
jgi:hypothetical protein